MSPKLLRLPWQGSWVPHALLDILRGCDISCRACYNDQPAKIKTLQQIKHELAVFMAQRKLDSISIVGGEPTLHPELCQIVRFIRQAGLSVELFTNGQRLTPAYLAELKAAGTNLIFLHIDAHQKRQDLPDPTPARLLALRRSKAAEIVAAGMEAGLVITAYPESPADIGNAVEQMLRSPHLDYLIVTLFRDTPTMGQLRGSLSQGISGEPATPDQLKAEQAFTLSQVAAQLRHRFNLQPFAYIGSNTNANDFRWLSYLIGTVVGNSDYAQWSGLQTSAIEPMFLQLFRKLHGRYPFYMPQSPNKFRIQLLLNALTGGRFHANLSLLAGSLAPQRQLRTKRILLQSPAYVGADGKLVHCDQCPDATLINDQLVPVCVSDLIRHGL